MDNNKAETVSRENSGSNNIGNSNIIESENGVPSEFGGDIPIGPLEVSFDDENVVNMPPSRSAGWGATIAGVAGNVLEWYDFAVFGYFSDVIGEVFFPKNQSGHKAIIESFAVFGGAFLMRPVGGVIMGYIGDVYGSKRALVISIFLMAFPTFFMGCLPSYERVGPFAIVGLLLVRLLQGLSVGGQLMSSMVYTLSRHPKRSWGLYGSYVLAAANIGTLLGGIAGFTIRALLTHQQVLVWGWRIPFLMGILVSISGFYLRSVSDDEEMTLHQQNPTTTHHQQLGDTTTVGSSHTPEASQPQTNPLRLAFMPGNRRALLAATMVPMLWSAAFYTGFVWMAIYMTDLIEPPIPNSFAVNSVALFVGVCIFFPLAGYISDHYGRKRIMTIGGIGLGIYSPLLLSFVGNYCSRTNNAWLACLAQTIFGILITLWGAPMCAWLVESFDPKARLTSCAVGYNVAQAIGGGLSPSLATALVDKYGPTSPAFILTGLAVVALVGLWVVAPSDDNKRFLKEKESFEAVPKDDVVDHPSMMHNGATGELT